ncbi:MAG: hypothetical protein M1561_02555 [Gammaproteobacteria bacterium]|nr:hypothetical protein [Gammaproteobacteria bacterium]
MQAKYTVHTSKLLFWLLIANHVGAVVCVIYLPFLALIKAGTIVCASCSLAYNLYCYSYGKNPKRVAYVTYYVNGVWQFLNNVGAVLTSGKLLRVFSTRYLLILHIKQETAPKRCKHVVISKDSMSTDDFRRLRVLLN